MRQHGPGSSRRRHARRSGRGIRRLLAAGLALTLALPAAPASADAEAPDVPAGPGAPPPERPELPAPPEGWVHQEPKPSLLDRSNLTWRSFNYHFIQWFTKPVARAYNVVLPKFAQQGVDNFLANTDRPRDILNSLLQLKFERAGRHTLHLLLNTSFGLGGFLYVSPQVLLEESPETFNETLGHWGVPPGPYIVLPVWGETSPRALLGSAGDVPAHPFFWIPGVAGTVVGGSRYFLRGVNSMAILMPTPFASRSEWDAFEELITTRTPYEEERTLWYENQQFDVED